MFLGIIIAILLFASNAFAQPICNGVTDDYAALNAEFTAPGYHWVTLPPGGSCVSSQPLTVNIGYVGVNFNGASIHSQITSGAALTLTSSPNSYNSFPVIMPRLWGDNKPGTVGLQVNANFTTLDSENISRFDVGEAIGQNGYLIHHSNAYIYNTTTALSCPGAPNSGEQLTFDGGALFNSVNGIACFGPGVILNGTSIDYISGLPINVSGKLSLNSIYMEERGIPTASVWIQLSGGNAWSHVVSKDSFFVDDSAQTRNFISTNNANTYAKFIDDYFSFGGNPQAIGSNASHVGFCGGTVGVGPANNMPNQGPC